MFTDVYSSGGVGGIPVILHPSAPLEPVNVNVTSFRSVVHGTQMLLMNNNTNTAYKIESGQVTDMIDQDYNCTSMTPDPPKTTMPNHRIELDFHPTHWKSETPVVTPVVSVVIPDMVPIVPDIQFLRAMMLQCMNDMSMIEHISDGTNSNIETVLPSEMMFFDTHAEFIDHGRLTMIKTQFEDMAAVGIAMSCIMISANLVSTEMAGSSLPTFIVTSLKGAIMVGTSIFSKSSLTMTVTPVINAVKNVIGDVKGIVVASTNTGLAMTNTGMNAVGNVFGYLKGWSIKQMIAVGCIAPPITLGTIIAVDQSINGRNSTRIYDTLVPLVTGVTYETSRIMTGMVTENINAGVAGAHDAPGLSDQVKEDIATVKDIVKTGYDTALGGVKSVATSVILVGALGTIAVVLVNQSKFNWAGISDPPAKRMKK
jgi:hypothetical protein